MSNIEPNCLCMLIDNRFAGTFVTAIRKLNKNEIMAPDYKDDWEVKGNNLWNIPDGVKGHCVPEKQLMRIDDYQPYESEIKLKEIVK